MNWKAKTEQKFEILSDFIFNNKIKVILSVLLIVVAFAMQLKNLRMDTSTEGFLHKNDSMRISYNEFRDQFGRDEKVLIAIKSNDIFTLEFINKLNKLHTELENNLPYIDEVNSLINARNTTGTIDSLIVDDLFEDLPSSQKALNLKKNLAVNNPLFKNLLLDDAGTITTIIIDTQTYTSLDSNGNLIEESEGDGFEDDVTDEPKAFVSKDFLTDKENNAIVKKTKEIVEKYQSKDFNILVSGTAVITSELKQSMQSDMQKFVRFVILMMAIFLAIMFKRVSGVVLPIITVLLTVVSTLALMAIFNAPVTVVTQILPSFLLAINIGASVHLLAIFFTEFNQTKDKQTSLRHAMGHSGLAIVMTSLTTAAGLWSFSFSEVAPVADLGKFASIGIIVGLIFTIILLPALLSLIKIKPKNIATKHENGLMDRVLLNVAHISTGHPKTIIYFSTIIIFISLAVASQLKFSHKPLVWFDEQHPVRVATDMIDKNLNGSVTLEIIVDTKTSNGLYEPKLLNTMEAFNKELLTLKTDKYFIGKTISLVDILKETNKALNANNKEFYKIPQNKNLIAQELLLFENSGSDDLEDFVDSQFSMARITVKVPYIDAIDYKDMLITIDQLIEKHFVNQDVEVTVTGISHLLAVIMEKSINSSAFSYLLALGLITVMMIILIGNVKIGIISMIPNIAPILMMVTVMVMFNMPLDMFTMLIGAIAIGLAVDDTVHFMHNFRRYELKYNNVNKAVEMTLLTTGRAMIVTTIVLTFGFFVFMGASMSNIFNFGLLTGIAIIIAVLADFFLVPAILKVLVRDKKDIK